jgi:tetratricopeptide (TPR) repeat protein
VFGHDYLAARVIQALLGSLSCGLLFLVGRLVFSRVIGAVAGVVAASYWMLIYFDGELLIPSLIVFLDLLLIWLLLQGARVPTKRTYVLAGIVLGLSAIARPNVLLFGPAIVIWLFVRYREPRRHALVYAACVTAACLLVVLPITVRNYVVGNDLVLIASQGGVNFYIGNNAQSDGRTAIVPGTPGDWWGGYYATIARAEQARGRKLKPSEVSRYYFGEAWDFISQHPASFLNLTARKLSLFWSRWEISNNKDVYFWTERFTPIVRLLPISFGLVGPLGILGLVLCWRRRGELFPLWGFVLVYMLGVVLFFCTARYRMPVLPPLILLAVYAAFQGVSAIVRARWRPALLGAVVLAAAAVFVNVTPDATGLRNEPTSLVMLGSAYEQAGDLAQAAQSYRRASELRPDYLGARYNLGTVLGRSGQLPEAAAELRRALTIRPNLKLGETDVTVALVHNNLGNVLMEAGDYAEAVEHYRAAIKLDPSGQARSQFNLGRALRALDRTEEAFGALKQALLADPDMIEAYTWSATILFEQGRARAGIDLLEKAVERAPQNDALLNDLAWYLATIPGLRQADRARAVMLARQTVARAPAPLPSRLDTLAAALAATGRFPEAVRTVEQAIALAEARGAVEAARQFRQRLDLYKHAQPYVESITPMTP